MSNANFSILVDFAAGGLVLASVLIVWRRDLRAIVRLLAWQGAALAAIPLLRGIRDNDRALIAVGIAVLALRALVLPWLLARAVGAEAAAQREATPLVNTASSLLITAGLTLTAFAITQPVVNLEPGVTINAVPAAFAVVLIALFVMTTRLHAVSQAAGFLMLDNGIAATAFLLTAGVPLIVELGASLDVLFAVIVIGVLTGTAASIGYIDTELAHGHIDGRSARLYGVLTPAFLCAMVLAVCANNIGVIWVAIEATTVITAFLVGHRRTRTALEATWKYVVICSVGIAVAFLGTVLLYFAARDSGAAAAGALNLDILAEHAAGLDPGVARLAGGLLLIGYGAKAGLFPFHTWLADAHSQAPAPVSALMSGVLLAVAFSVLIRLRPILDAVSGPAYLRNGLLVVGLATLLVAVLMLTVTGDVKRMLAYSSMEHMGLIAIAAAAGTTLAIAALLLHVLAHGIGKTVLFLAGGQLQAAHDSTAIADITGVMRRSRLIGVSFAVGLIVLLGLPPFAMFASELAIARSLANERLAWVLGAALLLIAIGFTALARNSGRMLLGTPAAGAPAITVPATAAAALMVGIVVSAALGITAGPLADLLGIAASNVGLP
ncbi:hydrogenase HycQ [Mycobacterium tuberculosis KT-0039]|nr:hydrogenase HycQ [Mycobacterium tuberculosis KT-0039]